MTGKLGAKRFIIGLRLLFIGVGTYGVYYAWVSSPNNPKNLAVETYNRGLDKLKKLNYSGAIVDFTQAISIEPKNIEFYLNRGLALRHTEDHMGAIQDFSKIIELRPENSEASAILNSERFDAVSAITRIIKIC